MANVKIKPVTRVSIPSEEDSIFTIVYLAPEGRFSLADWDRIGRATKDGYIANSFIAILTTEHPASSYGLPVLVDEEGQVIGPKDTIDTLPFVLDVLPWEWRKRADAAGYEVLQFNVSRVKDSKRPGALARLIEEA